MKILHIAKIPVGGAGIAAVRLHKGLREIGADSSFLFRHCNVNQDGFFSWAPKQNHTIPFRIARKLKFVSRYDQKSSQSEYDFQMQGRPVKYEAFNAMLSSDVLKFKDLPIKPDILHLHWIGDAFDLDKFLRSVPVDIPIVVTLHDMNAFTGGCHYTWNCKGYLEQCGKCPQLAHGAVDDLSRKLYLRKKTMLKNRSTHWIANSRWIEQQARESSLFSEAASVQTIHYGLETHILVPKEKNESRSLIGIESGKKVVTFGADRLGNERKGIEPLLNALKTVEWHEIQIVSFGEGDNKIDAKGIEILNLGLITSKEMLANIYSASDIFIMPSLYEAFGQVAAEAMLCGVPVIAFDSGGASDIVRDGENGLIVERGDVKSLAVAISRLLSDDETRTRMGENARQFAVEHFDLITQAGKHKDFYESLLNEN